MTKRKRTKRKLWSVARITHPQHPGIVLRLTELKAGGNLYVVRMVDGKQRMSVLDPRVTRMDLGKNDKEQRASACARAFEIIAKLAEGANNAPPVAGARAADAPPQCAATRPHRQAPATRAPSQEDRRRR